MFNRAHAGAESAPNVGQGHVPFQVDEVGRSVGLAPWDGPAGLNHSHSQLVELSVCRACDPDSPGRRVGNKAGEPLLVAQAPLRLTEEMDRRVEAAGDAEQIAVDGARGG